MGLHSLEMPIGPMFAKAGSVAGLSSEQWAFEAKWDGFRGLIEVNYGELRIFSRSGRDVTDEFKSLSWLGEILAEWRIVLDGEVVALDESGVSRFEEIQNHRRSERVHYWAFDLLEVDGRSMLDRPYGDRRSVLEKVSELTGLEVPELIPVKDGAAALEYTRQRGWEGVVAKRLSSRYLAGERGPSWIKDKNWLHQEVVIGGWRAGKGRRANGLGALLMGIPGDDGLTYCGAVGTGFTKAATISAARFYGKDVTMTMLKQCLFFRGIMTPADNQQLVEIDYEWDPEMEDLAIDDPNRNPHMREDVVRLGQGSTDLRYRAEFFPWRAELIVTYVESALSQDSVLSLIDSGGMGVGVGEWRPQRAGQYGTYQIDEDRPVRPFLPGDQV